MDVVGCDQIPASNSSAMKQGASAPGHISSHADSAVDMKRLLVRSN
jgi:hypothetical protein